MLPPSSLKTERHCFSVKFDIWALSKADFVALFFLLLWVILSLFGVLLKTSSVANTGASEAADSAVASSPGWVCVVCSCVQCVAGSSLGSLWSSRWSLGCVSLSGMEVTQHLWVLLSWVPLLGCLPLYRVQDHVEASLCPTGCLVVINYQWD